MSDNVRIKNDNRLGKKNLAGDSVCLAFIGTAISKELCERSSTCSVAGNKYQLGIIRGLEKAFDRPIHVVSVWPVAMYPHSRTIFSPWQTCRVGNLITARMIPFVNLPILKQVTMLLSIFAHLVVWLLRERKSDKRIVLVYNVFSPFSLAVLGATKLMGGTPIAIVADLPYNIYNFKGYVSGLLQRIDFFIQTHILNSFTAIIPLTQQIARDFAPRRPALVIEGGVEVDEMERIDARDNEYTSASTMGEKIILYSGALNDINGIELLLSAFRLLSGSQYRLHIYGRGPAESIVCMAAVQDKRIFYEGVLPNIEIKCKQTHATVLVNPRPSYREITRYTFPSKLLEYLISGSPTITTVLPGIPKEYYPYLYFVYDETPDGLAQVIQEVCSRDPNELKKFGQRAREFIFKNKNWEYQGKRIYDFICNL